MNKPYGNFLKSFIGKKSGYPIDVYYDEVNDILEYWAEPNGIYTKVFSNGTNSYSIIEDCKKEEPKIYKDIENSYA